MISNEGLIKSIKRFADIFQSLPVEAQAALAMEITSNGKQIVLEATSEHNGESGSGFCYSKSFPEGDDDFLAFRKSNVFDVCALSEIPLYDGNGNLEKVMNFYFIDFGYDYNGAAKVVQQLFDVFGMDINSFESQIWMESPDFSVVDTSIIHADKNGDIVSYESDGINMFKNVGRAWQQKVSEQQAVAEQQEKKSKKSRFIT